MVLPISRRAGAGLGSPAPRKKPKSVLGVERPCSTRASPARRNVPRRRPRRRRCPACRWSRRWRGGTAAFPEVSGRRFRGSSAALVPPAIAGALLGFRGIGQCRSCVLATGTSARSQCRSVSSSPGSLKPRRRGVCSADLQAASAPGNSSSPIGGSDGTRPCRSPYIPDTLNVTASICLARRPGALGGASFLVQVRAHRGKGFDDGLDALTEFEAREIAMQQFERVVLPERGVARLRELQEIARG